jgi:hypothetical protein
MGDILISMNKIEDAEKSYKIYEEKYPFDKRILEKLVDVYTRLGNKKQKNAYLKKLRKFN